jgi:hypothetical protein
LRRDELDLLQLSSFDSKVGRHLDYLARAYEVVWVRAELVYARIEFAATHSLGYPQAECAFALRRVLQTELTDYHLGLSV